MGISLQLYSLRNIIESNVAQTLKMVSQMGYTGVELAGYYDLSSAEFKKMLEANGLTTVGAHIGYEKLSADLEKEMTYNLEMGNNRLICPYYDMKNFEDVKKLAEFLNTSASTVSKSGAKIGYHNHGFEFDIQPDGRRFIDALLSETSKEVLFEFDVYWIAFAGADPLEYIDKYAGRLELLHLKELAKDEPKRNVEIGSGQLDFDAIIRAAKTGGTNGFVVEQEEYTMPVLESCEASCKAIKKLGLL